MNGYIAIEDMIRGKITEKGNRETIAAEKFAAVKKLKEIESKKTGKKQENDFLKQSYYFC